MKELAFPVALFCSLTTFESVSSLRLTQLGVPSLVRFGEPTWLNCSYALDRGERLYSVKWYKDNVEIYSHIPDEVPATKVFQHPGVDIDLGQSTVSDLFLRSTDAMSDGRYRCEVSQEGSFTTERAKKDLLVYDVPDGDPTLINLKSTPYHMNELLNVTCRFGPVKGTTRWLTWLINDTRVRKDMEIHNDIVHDDGRVTMVKVLLFRVQPKHVDSKGKLKLQCRGKVAMTFQLNSEEVRVKSRANSSRLQVIRGTEMGGPQIAGLYSNYRKQESLVVSCKTRDALGHRDNLTWFVNDRNASEWTSSYPIVEIDTSNSVKETELQLRVPLTQDNFQRSELRLRCSMLRSERIVRKAEASAHVLYHRFSAQSSRSASLCSTLPIAAVALVTLLQYHV